MTPVILGGVLLVLTAVVAVPEVIQVEPGQNVTLLCQAGNVTIRAVEWTRSDLVAPGYVLFHTDGHSDPVRQHSSFKGRVQLVDGELKTGDVSLILKNVSRDDSGTYECRVAKAGSGRKKRAIIKTDPISIIQLQVTDTEDKKGDIKDGDIMDGDIMDGDIMDGDIKDGDIKDGDIKDGDITDGNSPNQHYGLVAAAVFYFFSAVGLIYYKYKKTSHRMCF